MPTLDSDHATATPPIGWYVHLPFCTTKCGYCDFYSLPTIGGLIPALLDSLRREMEQRDPHRKVETVFVGGGTPTELPEEALAEVLGAIAARVGNVAEWTVEANPTSANELKLETLRRHGVNRISFGAQSFHPDELRVLDRRHDPIHIAESVHKARAVGLDNINLDLIYAIPGQTLERWRDNLRRAIDLGTDHLSCYALMYEKGTSLTRLRDQKLMQPCDEDLEADMFEMTIDELAAAGYEHYEISNFAKPGRQCAANIIYWENREYLGVGPSAVSFLNGVRRKNVPDVRKYVDGMQSDPRTIIVEEERLTPREFAGETAVQMLRLTRGIDLAKFYEVTGHDARELFAEQIENFIGLGLLEDADTSIRLTRRGLPLGNRVMSEFVGDGPAPQRFQTVDVGFLKR